MTRPQRYLTRMGIFVGLAIVVTIVLHRPLIDAFLANAGINGVILLALVLGLLYVFRQVWMLNDEVAWLEEYRSQRPGNSPGEPPKLLAPMAALLRQQQGQRRLSPTPLRPLPTRKPARIP